MRGLNFILLPVFLVSSSAFASYECVNASGGRYLSQVPCNGVHALAPEVVNVRTSSAHAGDAVNVRSMAFSTSPRVVPPVSSRLSPSEQARLDKLRADEMRRITGGALSK